MPKINTPAPDLEAIAASLLKDLMSYAEVTALNFFKDRFYEQGWMGNGFEPWPSRKTGSDGRALLTNTGNLRDSIRVLERKPLALTFGTSEPYAAIHNTGGIIKVRVTERSRKFFWYMYKSTGQAHWKWMALTKKTELQIKIPKRQFIGESPYLTTQIENWLAAEIFKRWKAQSR